MFNISQIDAREGRITVGETLKGGFRRFIGY
jgi:hypothetical protein